MIKVTAQAATSVVIALVTTVTTTAFTSYLLERPWCIQVKADNHQQVIYGARNCAGAAEYIHQKQTAQYQLSVESVEEDFRYWR